MLTPKQILGKTYQQKLATQEWRSFSTGIRKSRGNACQHCRRSDVVTQVHHINYEPNQEPWEADQGDVMLLCVACHKTLTEELRMFRKFAFRFMTPQAFVIFNRALVVAMNEYDPLIFSHAFAEFVGNERLVNNHAKAYGFETAMEPKRKPTHQNLCK